MFFKWPQLLCFRRLFVQPFCSLGNFSSLCPVRAKDYFHYYPYSHLFAQDTGYDRPFPYIRATLFYREAGANLFLRNIDTRLPDHTPTHPRGQ
jgi:hypothetical protein